MTPSDTATRLRQMRLARKETQTAVAVAVGVDRSMISKMENGEPGGRDTLVKLAEYYGVSKDWLLDEINAPPATRTAPLTDAEAEIVGYFRSMPEDVAEAFRKSMQAAAKKE